MYRFKINATSGVIGVNSPLDREKIASYKLTVEAADRGSPSMSSNREVIITVTDINDNDPIFTGEPYQGSIAEDASVGSPVVQVRLLFLRGRKTGVPGEIPRMNSVLVQKNVFKGFV